MSERVCVCFFRGPAKSPDSQLRLDCPFQNFEVMSKLYYHYYYYIYTRDLGIHFFEGTQRKTFRPPTRFEGGVRSKYIWRVRSAMKCAVQRSAVQAMNEAGL